MYSPLPPKKTPLSFIHQLIYCTVRFFIHTHQINLMPYVIGWQSVLRESQRMRDKFPDDTWIHSCNAYLEVDVSVPSGSARNPLINVSVLCGSARTFMN
jgi:hypothetical protein